MLLLATGVTSSVAQPWYAAQNSDLTSSAQPSAADPTVADDAFRLTWSSWQRLTADTTATTSATCDSCTGQATTLHVIYVRHPRTADLDNNAVAWADQCQSCSASALSVQVAVVRGSAPLTANNRALAVNAACEGCGSAAAAVQLVVVAPHAQRLSPGALADLRAWVADQSAQLRSLATDPTATPSAQARPSQQRSSESAAGGDDAGSSLLPGAMDSLESLVNSDLGSVTGQAHLDVNTP